MKMGNMKSVVTNQEQFAKIENPNIQRSTFDRSHGYKTTLDAGKLYPVFLDEALPGDTFNIKATLFGRLATPIKPIMDNIFFDIHFFSVPYRLVWANWKKFNGEQANPADTTNYLVPTITSTAVTGYGEESIYDYFGLPTKVAGIEHSALPLRAYNLIWNEWYRDENIQNSVTVETDDGPDLPTQYDLLYRGKRKDYFTSCLPFAQKGDDVVIPLGTTAPVVGTNNNITFYNTSDATARTFQTLTAAGAADRTGLSTNPSASASARWGTTALEADLSSATASTINALREAFQIQRMYEKDARGGTRYIELIKAHFGVTSPDARLQRPEFLGGGSTPINITPVAQTSSTDVTTPQGNLSGVGTFSINSNGFVKTFTEHEIVIGLVSVRADLNYQQGLHKMWTRSTRFDFYWPSFAHLGEQAVLSKEIYCDGTAGDDDVFGYQERYAEYRYKPSQITGLYRSNATASLDIWHLAQDFSARPSLNDSFIKEQPPIDRIVAISSEPQFLLDCFFDFKAARPMPTYSTPGLIDHF